MLGRPSRSVHGMRCDAGRIWTAWGDGTRRSRGAARALRTVTQDVACAVNPLPATSRRVLPSSSRCTVQLFYTTSARRAAPVQASHAPRGCAGRPRARAPARRSSTAARSSGPWSDRGLCERVYVLKHLAHTCPSNPVPVSSLPSAICAPRHPSARSTQNCLVHVLHKSPGRWGT